MHTKLVVSSLRHLLQYVQSGIFGPWSNLLGHLPFSPIRPMHTKPVVSSLRHLLDSMASGPILFGSICPNSHACKSGDSQSSSSVAIQSGIFCRELVMINLSFNSSLSIQCSFTISISPRDFSRVLARLSGFGLAPLNTV